MRIRKNNKLTASMIWSTAASSSSPNPPEELLQAHVCVVNRSPWDSPPSPPPPPPLDNRHFQAIERDNDSFGINGSLACDDSLPPDYSNRSIDSMKISIIRHSIESFGVQNSAAVENVSVTEAAHPPPKRRPGRPRKVPVAQAAAAPVTPRSTTPSNPEFYYYSGFGPRWGKRRGADDDDDNKKNIATKAAASGDRKRNNSNNNNNNNVAGGRSCSSSSCSRSLIEETDEELDFIDDDDDEDEDDGGRKRIRKPVKARSLKSLIM